MVGRSLVRVSLDVDIRLIFLLVFVLFLFRGRGWPMCGGYRRQDREEDAREILDRRYARAEISREEYQRMRKDLE